MFFVFIYLGLEPSLEISAVLGSDSLVVFTDVSHDFVEVFLWLGVYFYMDLSAHLGTHGQEFLKMQGKNSVRLSNKPLI